jgi:serine/alanine adding enzyme
LDSHAPAELHRVSRGDNDQSHKESEQTVATQQVRHADASDRDLWDEYVRRHVDAGQSHLFGWRDVIRRAYGHETYYLMAIRGEPVASDAERTSAPLAAQRVVGVFPLIHLKHLMFGNSLVSLPFLDAGGMLADSQEVEESLLSEAISLARKCGANRIELRSERATSTCDQMVVAGGEGRGLPSVQVAKRSSKVRMLLKLPETSDLLVRTLKSKLRSQINKPLREGCRSIVGGLELLEDFYRVFSVNMRDLGSPVHSVELMRQVVREFNERSKIFVVYRSEEPVAASLVVGFGKVLRNPWASSLRKYASLSPNMLLYLRMLEYGCDSGYEVFDFGRSTAGEGTYKFKEQWGAVPAPLCWYYISLDGRTIHSEGSAEGRFEKATQYWQRLPLAVTKLIGPSIRKHISL